MRPHSFVLSYLFRRPVFVTSAFIYFVLNWSIDMVRILCYDAIGYYRFLYERNYDLQYNQCTQCNQCIPFVTCLYALISTMFLLCISIFIVVVL